MPVRKANAAWEGTLREGDGKMSASSGAFEDLPYSFHTRFEEEPGTNPEELIGAAHAGCFSMKFAGDLESAGYDPERVETEASVHLDNDALKVVKIELETTAEVSDVDEEEFQEIAQDSKENCPISKTLAAVDEITLNATLQ